MKIVVEAKDGARAFECEPGENILYAGLRGGHELPYECGTGTCGTCKARTLVGEPASAWPEAPGYKLLKPGELLMCQALPGADCTLQVTPAAPPMAAGACVPAHLEAVIAHRKRLTHDVISLDLDLERPIDFEAGQFMVMTVPGIPGGRAYSMVNYARPTRRLVFVIKAKPGGRLSDRLFGDGVEGTAVRLFGPLGHATFHPDVGKHVLCIAGGSGIAGMMSILSRACDAEHFARWDGHVFFGVRTARDGFFLDDLEAFRARHPGRLAVTVALSDEDVPEALATAYPGFGFARGFVHAVAGERMQGRYAGVRAWVAGPPPMVDASLRLLLREARLSPADIRYDKFS